MSRSGRDLSLSFWPTLVSDCGCVRERVNEGEAERGRSRETPGDKGVNVWWTDEEEYALLEEPRERFGGKGDRI